MDGVDDFGMGVWGLPSCLLLGGEEWAVNADFRDILHIFAVMEDCGDSHDAAFLALALFYRGFDDMPPALYGEAWRGFCTFLRCGEAEHASPGGGEGGMAGTGGVKLIDWRQDAALIASEVNRVAGREIRAEGFVHWHTFMGWLRAIGEGPLATVVGIRAKRARGKRLSDPEREFYRDNRAMVDLRRPLAEAEAEEKARLLEMLRGPNGRGRLDAQRQTAEPARHE